MTEALLPADAERDAKRLASPQEHEVECPYCGLLQFVAANPRSHVTSCVRCHSRLEHCAGTSLDASLCCAIAALLLLIPAWTLPFLTTYALGTSRTSRLPASITIMWREDQPLLAVVVCLFLLIFPIMRLTTQVAVLFSLRVGQHPPWLGRVFRLCNALETWAMLDVFLLGLTVAYARLRSSIATEINTGAICFIAAVIVGLVARATLDRVQIWRMIAPERRVPLNAPVLACPSCGLLLPASMEGKHCPRCETMLRVRQRSGCPTAIALLIASLLLYLPANFFPIATIPIGLTPTSYTVLGGVIDLVDSHLWGLALLVFTASFTIPLLKMAGLTWCIVSTLDHHHRHLIAKTRVYRIIEEFGRWSMVDPLTIACFVPVLQYSGLIDGHAQPAATPFTGVVVLTTLAVKFFDPRIMWDATSARR